MFKIQPFLNLISIFILFSCLFNAIAIDLSNFGNLGLGAAGNLLLTLSKLDVQCEFGSYKDPASNSCQKCPTSILDCIDSSTPTLCGLGNWLVWNPGHSSSCSDTIPSGYRSFKYDLPIPETNTTSTWKQESLNAMITALSKLVPFSLVADQANRNQDNPTYVSDAFPTTDGFNAVLTALVKNIISEETSPYPEIVQDKLFVSLLLHAFKLHVLANSQIGEYDFPADFQNIFSLNEVVVLANGSAGDSSASPKLLMGIAIPCYLNTTLTTPSCKNQVPTNWMDLGKSYSPRCPFGSIPNTLVTPHVCTTLSDVFANFGIIHDSLRDLFQGQSLLLPLSLSVQRYNASTRVYSSFAEPFFYVWSVSDFNGMQILAATQGNPTTNTSNLVINNPSQYFQAQTTYIFSCKIQMGSNSQTFTKDIFFGAQPVISLNLQTGTMNEATVPKLEFRVLDLPADFTVKFDGAIQTSIQSVTVDVIPANSSGFYSAFKLNYDGTGMIAVNIPPSRNDESFLVQVKFDNINLTQSFNVTISGSSTSFGQSSYSILSNFDPYSSDDAFFYLKAASIKGLTNVSHIYNLQANFWKFLSWAKTASLDEALYLLASLSVSGKLTNQNARDLASTFQILVVAADSYISSLSSIQTIAGLTFSNPKIRVTAAQTIIAKGFAVINSFTYALENNFTDPLTPPGQAIFGQIQMIYKRLLLFGAKYGDTTQNQLILSKNSLLYIVPTTSHNSTGSTGNSIFLAPTIDSSRDVSGIGDLADISYKLPMAIIPSEVAAELQETSNIIFLGLSVVKSDLVAAYDGCGAMNRWLVEIFASDLLGNMITAVNFSSPATISLPSEKGQGVIPLFICNNIHFYRTRQQTRLFPCLQIL